MRDTKALCTGLRERPTFEKSLGYLAGGQGRIKYPDRTATRIMNHPYITNILSDSMTDRQLQQEKALKENEKEQIARELASSTARSAPELRATASSPSASPSATAQAVSADPTTQFLTWATRSEERPRTNECGMNRGGQTSEDKLSTISAKVPDPSRSSKHELLLLKATHQCTYQDHV